MFKKLVCVLTFLFLIYTCAIEGALFYGQEVTVATNSSSGSFYSVDKYLLYDIVTSSGASKEYSKDFDYENRIVNRYNAKLVKTETVGEVTNLYYYSKNLSDGIYISGKKVNLHIAVSHDSVIVGYPIIYYGF